ncbi:alpha/beta hydrolase [Paracoccus luteus]|uniref:alpha/beta hydrolase n=1 Tax=Paracoccus luteus TaxID=2508543 RepID=UPI00106FBB85|nr:alpha/beta hydrolase [Paracoccus luteus]
MSAFDADLGRAALDADYGAQATVGPARFAAIMADYRAATDAALARLAPAEHVHDPQSGERLDLWGADPEGAPRPAVMFIHGGYWRMLARGDSGFMAPMLAERGIATVVPDYSLSPAVTLAEIVRQVRASFAWLWTNAPRLNIDRKRIVVTGNSAGGHLVGMLMADGWRTQAGLPRDAIAGAMPISGLYDLGPLSRCFPQDWLSLSQGDVAALSPLANLPARPPKTIVVRAGFEPAGFVRQSDAFAAALGQTVRVIEGRNHFDVILDLADAESEMARLLLSLVGPGRG